MRHLVHVMVVCACASTINGTTRSHCMSVLRQPSRHLLRCEVAGLVASTRASNSSISCLFKVRNRGSQDVYAQTQSRVRGIEPLPVTESGKKQVIAGVHATLSQHIRTLCQMVFVLLLRFSNQ